MSQAEYKHKFAIQAENFAAALVEHEQASQKNRALTAECQQLCEDITDELEASIDDVDLELPHSDDPEAAQADCACQPDEQEPDAQEGHDAQEPGEQEPDAHQDRHERSAAIRHEEIGCLAGIVHAYRANS